MWPHCGKNSTCLFSVDVAHFKERCSWFFSLDVANVEIKYTWIVFCVAHCEIKTSIWFLNVVHCEKDYTCSSLGMWRTVKRTLYRFSSWMWRTVKRTLCRFSLWMWRTVKRTQPFIIYGAGAQSKNLYLGLSSLWMWRTIRKTLPVFSVYVAHCEKMSTWFFSVDAL
jgi:hypothetical protein